MLAVIKTNREREIVLSEVAPPKLSSGEVLIRVEYCGICGSDLHAYKHARGYEFVNKPRILGHEIVGRVIDVFDGQNQNLINKTVVVESIQYCGECSSCREGRMHICENFKVIGLHFDGGMADYVKCQSKFIQLVPQGISKNIAVLVEPMAIAVHAVERIGRVKSGETVLVQGPGIIGLFVALVCLSQNASVILSGLPSDYPTRLIHATKFGIIPHIVGEFIPIDNQRIDTIFECSGSAKAFTSGIKNLRKGGKCVVVALYEENVNLFLTEAVRNEWAIMASYGCCPDDYKQSFGILQHFDDKIKGVISYYPVAEVHKAFTDALQQSVLKPVLSFNKV